MDTLSFHYEGLADDEGRATEIYIHDGNNHDRLDDDDVPYLTCRIEAAAPRNAVTAAEFIGIRFAYEPPETGEGKPGDAKLRIDAVTEAVNLFDEAVRTNMPVTVSYRPYLFETRDEGPQIARAVRFAIAKVTIDATTISTTLQPVRTMRRLFPGDRCDIERYPGLIR